MLETLAVLLQVTAVLAYLVIWATALWLLCLIEANAYNPYDITTDGFSLSCGKFREEKFVNSTWKKNDLQMLAKDVPVETIYFALAWRCEQVHSSRNRGYAAFLYCFCEMYGPMKQKRECARNQIVIWDFLVCA